MVKGELNKLNERTWNEISTDVNETGVRTRAQRAAQGNNCVCVKDDWTSETKKKIIEQYGWFTELPDGRPEGRLHVCYKVINMKEAKKQAWRKAKRKAWKAENPSVQPSKTARELTTIKCGTYEK